MKRGAAVQYDKGVMSKGLKAYSAKDEKYDVQAASNWLKIHIYLQPFLIYVDKLTA